MYLVIKPQYTWQSSYNVLYFVSKSQYTFTWQSSEATMCTWLSYNVYMVKLVNVRCNDIQHALYPVIQSQCSPFVFGSQVTNCTVLGNQVTYSWYLNYNVLCGQVTINLHLAVKIHDQATMYLVMKLQCVLQSSPMNLHLVLKLKFTWLSSNALV